MLEQAERQFKELLNSKDKKQQGPAVARLQQLVACLDERTDPQSRGFLLKCFENAAAFAAIKSEPSGTDLNESDCARARRRGTPKMQQQLVAAPQDADRRHARHPRFSRPAAIMSPADFYKEFSPLLKDLLEKRGKKNSLEHDRGTALLSALTTDN